MDRLTNIRSGMGTTADKRSAMFYAFAPLSGPEAEAGYRSSWLVRKIVDVPPFDMVREWRDWQADSDTIAKLEAEEKRLGLKPKVERALVLARLFGGSAIILGTRDSDTTQPLNPDTVKQGGLVYLHVLSRHQIGEGQRRGDPADPWFGQPDYFELSDGSGNNVKLHPSRVIPFLGQKAPEGGFYPSASWFWGDPIMQSIGDAVKNADLAQSGFAALIDRAAVDVFKFKDLMSVVGTDEGQAQIQRRVDWTAQAKSTYRAMLIDSEDDWQQVQISWTGIPDVMLSFMDVVAGAADIPLTRLLGQSPRGLQSTGDGEARDYHSMIKARQSELLTPAFDRIDELLIRSAIGSRPDDIYYEYGTLDEANEKDEATIEFQFAQAIQSYTNTGLFPDDALAAIAKNRIIESGRWPGSETAFDDAEAAAAAEPEGSDDPSQLTTREQNVKLLTKRGTVTASQADALITDGAPRSLYVSRKLLNGADFIKWAKEQGFQTTVPAAELHVTVLFSRTPVDWMKMGSGWDQDSDGKLKVAPGGARMVDKLGDKGAVVLLFASSALSWRHEDMVRNGASHDFDDYQPHVTITYEGGDVDLSKVEPYRGELVFGPEIFAEIVDDWEQSLMEA